VTALSIVVVTFNSRSYVDGCLDALPAAADGLETEVIVVDGASADGSAAHVAQRGDVAVIPLRENVGFARANNRGIERASGDIVLLLNPDTVPAPGSLRLLHDFLGATPACGAVGPRLETPDGVLQPSAGALPTLFGTFVHAAGLNRLLPRDERRRARLHAVLGLVMPRSASRLSDHAVARRCEVVWAAAIALRRTALDQIGILDEGLFMYGEENDLCARLLRGGWQVWFLPSSRVLHIGGGSAPFRPALAAWFYQSRRRYFRRNGAAWQAALALPAIAGGLALRPATAAAAERSVRAATREASFAAQTLRLLLTGGTAR
jgi:hypothetical protein